MNSEIAGLRVLSHLSTSQNIVLKVMMDDDACALRLTSPGHRSTAELAVEVRLLSELQNVTDCVIAPRPFRSGRMLEPVRYEGGEYCAALFPFVDGPCAEPSSQPAATKFGELLAKLHDAFDALAPIDELAVSDFAPDSRRIIHGDFHASNVLRRNNSWVVIDFEGACYSSPEFELGNTLYMQLFDSRHSPDALIEMGFLAGFLEGYTRERAIAGDQLLVAMSHRVSRLEGWLSEPASAPQVISASPQAWRDELATFTRSYARGGFRNFLDEVSKLATAHAHS